MRIGPRTALLGFIAVCLGAGALGGLATSAKIPSWYATLQKPDWNPPSWVFGPVWTTLYVMMAVAAWLVWKQRHRTDVRMALGLFAIQLVLNTLWSFLFFGLESPGAALVEIAALWAAIVATVAAFRRPSPLAAWLLAPYLLWVSFASVLNFTIWRVNG